MSTASKVTFGVTCLVSAMTVVGVHFVQALEREALHQGPIKDAERLRLKAAQRSAVDNGEISEEEFKRLQKRMVREEEHEVQKQLRAQYEAVQPLTGEVVVDEKGTVNK
ncbi:petite colonies protein [Nadsonia fulvescens var. elongata DSM 6958]|uniref:Petite colonies protein n=1 Tax=Nadsonia fulvescens var. elongata DSM 6958 TaxID=857566 RepID=A0A1E3PCB5_9ASCO|nr:petite colonies protein [Nadsonia fulvescens var. elongata DSM 6958]